VARAMTERAGWSTTCSVRLNRESTSGGLLRDVSGVLLSVGRCSKPSIGSDFAKL